MMGWFSEAMMNRRERHASRGVFKDGRELEGYFYWIRTGPGKYQVGFEPAKNQPDGSIWISARTGTDLSKLPTGDNVFRDEMLDSASFSFEDPAGAGLEPAMIKILLGMMYLDRGRDVLRHAAFNVMRSCLSCDIPPQVDFNWVSSVEELRARWPFEICDSEHTIWGGCPDGKIFKGGVSLFAKVMAEITIRPFDYAIAERVANIPLNIC
jgi:hypothetical protein